MGTPDNRLSELVDLARSWIPPRAELVKLPRDFWMPDQSCRVCYECDSQFNVFNRKHHCRLCGRVFCARCTSNSIPALSDEQKSGREDWEIIRVCNYCLKQWEQGTVGADNGGDDSLPVLSPSLSAVSLVSTKSFSTCNSGSGSSSVGSIPPSTGPYKHVTYRNDLSPHGSPAQIHGFEQQNGAPEREPSLGDSRDQYYNQSDDEDDDYGLYNSDSESRHYGCVDDMEQFYGPFQVHHDNHSNSHDATSTSHETYDVHEINGNKEGGDKVDADPGFDGPSLGHDSDSVNAEQVDFENNGLLWLPPEPEDEEDEKVVVLFDDDDGDGANGEWGYLHSSNSFGRAEFRNRERRAGEDQREAMKNVVEGHFRALIAQLLQVENLHVGGEDGKESWLEIISSLCWEAASLLKPDMSKGGGMDPGGYVKVKCIACGWRGESEVIKGVVCKKNVAHRRMPTRIDRPRFLILGGALEYQRVANHLSSFDTLLQQEMDHLKMAVAKIDAHHPHVLLVEKSVSRHAQEYLLAKDISLVLNIKRPLLERIARCSGAQIVPSIDHLTSPKLGYCESFHVDKFIEVHGSAGQGGKNLVKTLMFFEGCPKPFGCTILLKGANGDELKKVKHVVQYGVFAAYHLALETSFLADEGASLPDLSLESPLAVALPDKPSIVKRSISTIPGFVVTPPAQPLHVQTLSDVQNHDRGLMARGSECGNNLPTIDVERQKSAALSEVPCCHNNVYEDSAMTEYHRPQLQFAKGSQADHEKSSPLASTFDEVAPTLVNAEGGLQLVGAKDGDDHQGELGSSKEEFPPSPSDNQSILVSLSTRCVWKGTVCERSHLIRIKYYGSFDRPLGRFLCDHLFDENYRCRTCDMPSEAHIHCYTHRQGSLTISVRKLREHLPGEAEGKIWMWHRCLKCPRKDGFPLATRRVVMSDAAWGLSFGKFLELSFSNHAAASRVASCGHSLHRDCLRFYGFGRMVACFRYASIHVHSVYLPPLKVDFNFGNMEWLQKEANELRDRAELLFSEVHNALERVLEKSVGSLHEDGNYKASQARSHMKELEKMLLKQKEEFMELLRRTLGRDSNDSTPSIDILEINKLRRQLLYYSYNWDQSLICVLKPNNKKPPDSSTASIVKPGDKIINSGETPVEAGLPSGDARKLGYGSYNSFRQSRSSEKGCAEDLSNRMTESDPLLSGKAVHQVLSEGECPEHVNCSDTHAGDGDLSAASLSSMGSSIEASTAEHVRKEILFLDSSFDASTVQFEKFGISEYNPVYVRSVWELERRTGARLLLPVGLKNTVVPVYDDEPTSIISHALISSDYRAQLSNPWKANDGPYSSLSLPLMDPVNILTLNSLSESAWDSLKSIGSYDEKALGSSSSVSSPRDLHVRVTFTDDGPQGKAKYTVTCYYAEQFEVVRNICCPSEMDYVRSLSRCKKWGAQGGKSNVFFAKTLDDRFIIKQVTKTELESFIKFGPAYFKYLSESINTKSPTCLAKILGIYQISTKHVKSGKESKIDVLVMENLLFRRNVARLYDLKGSSRARYNPDTGGSNKVLLDQNLIEAMPTSPIFVGNKAKRLLERAVWNDTAFLASIDVMDYSLLVGVDEERDELVLGIIDFMRQYTWDKHLETWVKTSGILGGPKNASPTVVSPQMYKKRFRKAMSTYFLMVPDQWSPPLIIPSINSKCEGDDEAQVRTNNNTTSYI
ncbi:hypothetical protein MLD38_014723 [Melastoma candidum]|uniref:Uncharacterized protein n=1 Tax=Melastoma candidum TaxID=119954 RepID=A0ACB9RHV4_9MYRT|nr:hypothetical protein MLD38_014723 [Melastoma candidum]